MGHFALDVAGMIPIFGALFDGANAAWYLAEGNKTQAALSTLSAVPGIGDAVGMARFGKVFLQAGKVCKTASTMSKAAHAVRTVERITQGVQGAYNVFDGVRNVAQNGLSVGSVAQVAMGFIGVGAAARAPQLPCFLAGTLVSTPDGLRRIEEILSGDRVWGYDLRSGEWRDCMVSYHSSIAYDDLVVTVRAGGKVAGLSESGLL